MNRPLVSTVISNYNYGRFLRDCIDSVLAQSYAPVEVIVVDDGSTDDSREILNSYGARIRAIFQQNAGQGAAISRGVLESRGDVIAFLDCDDGWYPDKLQRVVDVFEKYPQVSWVRHKAMMVSEALEPLHSLAPRFRGSGIVPPDPTLFLERIVYCQPSVLALRRAVALRIFPLVIEPELRFDADDTVLLGRVFATGATGYSIDEVLSFYRRHPGERFGGHDLPRLLTREAEFTAALPRMFGRSGAPSPTFKHRSVLAALAGAPLWSRRRLVPFVQGLGAVARLYTHPALMMRQLIALMFAAFAPKLWLRRLARWAQWPTMPEHG